jgi:hypothetical protein
MRICERILLSGVMAALLLLPVGAQAFEAGQSARPVPLPRDALPVLPSAPQGLPGGSDLSIRDALRGFLNSYKTGNKAAAIAELERAAALGNIVAMWRLGRLHAEGDGVPQDDFKAFQLFSQIIQARRGENRESPDAGVVARAMVATGAYWLEGIPNSPVKASPQRALDLFSHAALYFGDSQAQYSLARMYIEGTGVPKDAVRAARWLNLAAEKGHVYAQAVLGQMLFAGSRSLPRQPARGLMWLHAAREQADPAKDLWVIDLFDKATAAATEDELKLARVHFERFTRAVERR